MRPIRAVLGSPLRLTPLEMLATDTSIAIDSNDDVHISYRDATNGDLKYATDKSGSWVTTSIDTSGNVGYLHFHRH